MNDETNKGEKVTLFKAFLIAIASGLTIALILGGITLIGTIDVLKEQVGKNGKVYQWVSKKILGGCAVLLAGLSIASIADATFQFTGFIRTGIEFYLSITEPLRAMLDQLIWFEVS